ncbi:hypothetical protein EVAR_16256_1 [Eumeta japonica]|uniref:Uncharacterized protein n=1 Tax=Eumeta variegata TaxID=151549 RepID=A0A4C1U6I5_EUMVA|nr:hypothetical protein EVAR_16256_1 [Eumeta japonica]
MHHARASADPALSEDEAAPSIIVYECRASDTKRNFIRLKRNALRRNDYRVSYNGRTLNFGAPRGISSSMRVQRGEGNGIGKFKIR